MSKMFDPEGKFAHYGGKIGDLMGLNILTLLGCLPVVTAGASVAAMHYVLLKIFRDEETAVTKMFFKSFRENLRQSAILLGIFGVIVYLLFIGIRVAYSGQNSGMFRYVFLIAAVLVLCVMNWGLILQSRYRNSVFGTIKLALNMCLAYPARSVVMMILAVLPILMLLVAVENLVIVLMAGMSLTGFLQTALYNGAFRSLEQKNEQQPDGVL